MINKYLLMLLLSSSIQAMEIRITNDDISIDIENRFDATRPKKKQDVPGTQEQPEEATTSTNEKTQEETAPTTPARRIAIIAGIITGITSGIAGLITLIVELTKPK